MKIKLILMISGILLLTPCLPAAPHAPAASGKISSVLSKKSKTSKKSLSPRVFSPIPEEIPLYVLLSSAFDEKQPHEKSLAAIHLPPEMISKTRITSHVTVRPHKEILEKPGIWNDLSRQADIQRIIFAGSVPVILENPQDVPFLKLKPFSMLPKQNGGEGVESEYLFTKETSFDFWRSLHSEARGKNHSPLGDLTVEATDLLEHLNGRFCLTDGFFELYGPTPLLLREEFFAGESYEYIGWDISTLYGRKGRLITMSECTLLEPPPFTAPEPGTWGLLLLGGAFIFVRYKFYCFRATT